MASSIINSDDGSVSGTTGLKTTGGDDGELAFESSGTEAMRIASNGDISFYEDTGTTAKFFWDASAERLRIGSTSLTAYTEVDDVVIEGSASVGMSLLAGTSSIAGFFFGDSGSSTQGQLYYDNATDSFTMWTNATSDSGININSSGQTGLGSAAGGYFFTNPKLTVRGGDSTLASAGTEFFTGYATTTKYAVGFSNGNGTIGGIYTNGTSTTYATSSDYRLKENITPITDGISRLKQLKPSRFNFIADPSTTVDGFLAHEAQSVVPEAVSGTKDEMTIAKNVISEEYIDDVGNKVEQVVEMVEKPAYQTIDQSKLVPLLTAALQEAVAKIEALETRIAALEG